MRHPRPLAYPVMGLLGLTLALSGCAGNGSAVGGAAGGIAGGAMGGAAGMVETPAPAVDRSDPTGNRAERVARPVAVPDAPSQAGQAWLASHAGGPTLPLKDVFFDTDRARIREDAQAALSANLAWLRANPGIRITIEGHCDERGTSEYNLALGERRARAVRDYLAAAGIVPPRITTLSYGKERPAVPGHDESAWRWNRRAHFAPAYPQVSQQR